MTTEQVELRRKFLEPETRDGYYVSADMKEVWRCILDILEQFIRVCEKYDLKWTMEAGSLLGAMRHHGFIPWDDDIDVSMPRKDYDRLMKVLPDELPSGLFMQTSETDCECQRAIMRICNSNTSAIDEFWTKRHCCMNMGIFLDILPVDPDPVSKFQRYVLSKQKTFYKWIRRYRFLRGNKTAKECVYKSLAYIIYTLVGGRRLFMLRELPYRLMAKRNYANWMLHPAHMDFQDKFHRKASWYSEFIDVPFEYLTVKVSKCYDAILTQQFGNWRVPVKGGAYHGISMFDVHRCYRDILVEKFGYTTKEISKLS